MSARTGAVLVALALAGCAGGERARPRPAAPPAPSLAGHPAITSCRTTPAACHGAAWSALRAEGDFTGDWAAAAFLMAGCEGGHAPSCADLGELYAAGRGVPLDHGRACDLGRTASCAKAGRSPPFVAGRPTAPLPPPAPVKAERASAGEVEAYVRLAWTMYPELHAPLGLTREALAATPPAAAAERALVNLVVARRMPPVAACVPGALEPGKPGPKLTGIAAFTVDPAGRPAGLAVRVPAGAPYAEEAGWARCARELVEGWTLPLVPSGGRLWLSFAGTGPVHEGLPGPGAPAFATSGHTKPAPEEPGCVERSIRLPYRFRDFTSDPIVAVFAVEADGAPRWFSVANAPDREVPPEVVEAIWKAVGECGWRPGRDPGGQPTSLWVVLPLRFSHLVE